MYDQIVIGIWTALGWLKTHPWQIFFSGLYILAILNSFRIVLVRQSSSTIVAWILLHAFLPIIALPLYFLIGQNRMRGFVRRKRRSDRRFHQFEPQLGQRILAQESLKLPNDDDTPHLREFSHVFSRYGEVFWPTQSHVDLLIDGEQTFASIFLAISRAENFIFVQYYILRSDRLGIELKEALIARARAGVKVFLLYDDMGSFWLPRQYIRELKDAGVQVERFLPMASATRFFQMNFRNHRKLVLIDGKIAFTGGLNVGEEYVGRRIGAVWRDTHVKIEGPAVAQLAEVFFDDWYFAAEGHQKIEPVNVFEAHIPEKSKESSNDIPERSKTFVQVIASGPADSELIGVFSILQLLTAARTRIWIATPYFIPDEPVMRALELAFLRGVDVRILLPSRKTRTPIQWASVYYAEELSQFGIPVFFYKPGFMHQKVILVDDNLSAIGTNNIDQRTMYLNFETNIYCHGRSMAAAVRQMLETDFSKAERFSQKHYGSIQARMRRSFSRLLAPLL